jgi:CheY-like chemotaxis protein
VRILYVEDNATNVILVQRVANMGKHEVMNYDDGQEALDHYEQYKPDLILLDVQLRGALTGLDVAHTLRTKGCTSPIIAVTAYAMKGDRQRCLDAGCDDYLPKPISVAELVTVFKRYGDAVAAGKPIASTFKVTSAQPSTPVEAVAPQPIVLAPSSPAITPVTEPAAPTPSSADASSAVPLEAPVVSTTPAVETAPQAASAAASEPAVTTLPSLPEITPVESSTSSAKAASETTPATVDMLSVPEKVIDPPAVEPVAERIPAPMNAEP